VTDRVQTAHTPTDTPIIVFDARVDVELGVKQIIVALIACGLLVRAGFWVFDDGMLRIRYGRRPPDGHLGGSGHWKDVCLLFPL
jgi:hypothetical protein